MPRRRTPAEREARKVLATARRIVVPAEAVHRIRKGEQTTARLLVKGDEPNPRLKVGDVYGVHVPVTVNGVGRLVERSRVLVHAVFHEPLRELEETFDTSTGLKTLEQFRHEFVALHDRAWLARREAAGEQVAPIALQVRYEQRWADQRVWVVEFSYAADEDIYLAPTGRASDELGYTQNPTGALEPVRVVQVAELDPAWGKASTARHARAKQDERRLEEQLASVLREAEELGIDIAFQQAAIRRRIIAVRRVIDQRKAA